jgi:TonB family protein
MPKIGFFSACAAIVLAAAFPPASSPQTTPDNAGVTVDLNGAPLLHRSAVRYPREAILKGVRGTVVAQVKLSDTGEVSDARVVSGPEELRSAVLQSVLDWHFSREAAGSTREVNVTFELPKQGPPAVAAAGVVGGIMRSTTFAAGPSRVASIRVAGLSEAAQNELRAQLPVHEGDTLTAEFFAQLRAAVQAFDEHLSVSISRPANGGDSVITITAPGAYTNPPAPQMAVPPGTIMVGGATQAAKLVTKTTPVYPPLAKQARIQGVVHLMALIGKDGTVQNLQVISGHPLLIQSALDAVRTWTYQPTLLNGNPVTVQTQIDVNFTLAQ